jgi:hypothetical protein
VRYPYVVFFAVPLVFWWLISRLTQQGHGRVLSAVITGNDGRLSLSRLQAFLWTMLILGSFCAAMVARPWPANVDKAEVTVRENALQQAKVNLDAAVAALAAAEAEMASRLATRTEGRAGFREAEEAWKHAATADKKPATALLTEKGTALRKAEIEYTAAVRQVERLRLGRSSAEDAHDDAKKRYRRTQWVKIPTELLALAGISLATGVFSAAISAGNDTSGAPPTVWSIGPVPVANLPPGSQPTLRTTIVEILGKDFGSSSGEVRFDGRYLRPLHWSETVLYLDEDPNLRFRNVTVDTAGGKASYENRPAPYGLTSVVILETRDLFREDSNPRMFSITKFQMFAWTLVAIAFYTAVLLSHLDASIDALPTVDATLVMLTGLSAGGYLGGKAAANMSPQK